MFEISIWQEVLSTMRKNLLRTILTSFSVFWGIFILMILLGSGNGLKEGVMHNFSDANNCVWLWGGRTSKAYGGFNKGRKIQLKNDDIQFLGHSYENLENLSGNINLPGAITVSYKNNYDNYNVQAILPGHQATENVQLIQGRLLNILDIEQYRKVTIIGKDVKEQILKDEDPIGKYVNIREIPFLVVGVFDDIHPNELKRLYIPISVAHKTFIPGSNIGTLTFTLDDYSVDESESLVEEVKQSIALKHRFDAEDPRALGNWNALKEYKKMQALFNGINVFVGVMGIFTLIAGIVGVSNIMLIVVRERTKEIGIRKAIGATPGSVVGLIIFESIIITSIAGYLGLLCGISLLELLAGKMPASDFFRNPGVDFRIAVGAALLVVFAGALAGFVPARKASRIKPIVALRDE